VVDGQEQEPEPYFGYYFQVLQSQGPNAPGGAMRYIINGNMMAGHALIAFASTYGDTGTMSFMIGENGTVWVADLGGALERAQTIESFDPAEGWPLASGERTAAR
jgi:hypothetical protein